MSRAPLKAKHGLIVQDPTDQTKQVQFDVSGVSTGTTHTLKVPNSDSTIAGSPASTSGSSGKFAKWTATDGVLDVTTYDQTSFDTSGAASSAVSTHAGLTSTHGVSGSIVGTSDTQILTNKDVDGGTASDSNRVTLPSNTTSNISGLTRKAGTIIHDTTKTYPVIDDGSALHDLITNDDTQVLQNKTFADASDVTKKLALGLSNITASTTRTLTAQDRNGIIADVQNVLDNSVDKAGYYFTTDGTAYITVANNANILFAPNHPFSILSTLRFSASGACYLINKSNGSFDEYTVGFVNGTYFFQLVNATSQNTNYITKISVATFNDGNVHTFCATYNGNAAFSGMNLYVDGLLQSATTAGANYTAMGDGTVPLIIGGAGDHTTNHAFKGQLHRQLIFNYDISAYPDKLRRYFLGGKLDFEDIGGSMVPVYGPQSFAPGDYASWNVFGGAVKSNTTPTNNALNVTGLYGSVTARSCYIVGSNYVIGKRYRVIAKINCASGTKTIAFGTSDSNVGLNHLMTITSTPTVYYYDMDYPADTTNNLQFGCADANNVAVTIDDLSVIRLGAVLVAEPQNITDTTWYDISGNSLNGTVTNAVSMNKDGINTRAQIDTAVTNSVNHIGTDTGVHGVGANKVAASPASTAGSSGKFAKWSGTDKLLAISTYDENSFDLVNTASSAVSTHAALTATHGVTGAIVGTTNSQNLQNKTFADTSDATKKLALGLSNITASTTRTLTAQDRNGIIADVQNVLDNSVDKPSYYFNGSNAYVSGSLPTLGDSDFTIIFQMTRLIDHPPNTVDCILSFFYSDINNRFAIMTQGTANNDLYFLCQYTNSGPVQADHIINAGDIDTFFEKNKSTTVIWTRLGLVTSVYKNGQLVVTNTATVKANFGSNNYYIASSALLGVKSNINSSRLILCNYSMDSSLSKITKYSVGAKLDWEDIGGSMTDISASSTWSNPGGFSSYSSSGNSLTAYSTGGNYSYLNLTSFPIVVGKKYRIYYTNTGAANIIQVYFVTPAGSQESIEQPYIVNSATQVYVDLTASATDPIARLTFQRNNAGSGTSGAFTLKIVELGAVLDLEPEGIIKSNTNQWLDSSGNGLHGTPTNALPQSCREYLEIVDSSDIVINNPVSDTVFYDTGISLTLTAGEWDIDFNAALVGAFSTYSSGAPFFGLFLGTGLAASPTILQTALSINTAPSTVVFQGANLNGHYRAVITSTTTYKLFVKWGIYSGAAATLSSIHLRGDANTARTYIKARRQGI